jgi:DNA-binding MarR family transcriptional regulator
MEAARVRRGRKAAVEVRDAASHAGVDLGALPGQLGYVLRRAQLAVVQSYAGSFAEAGLRPGQYSVLAVLDGNPGLSPSVVADALAINRTNFVPLFDSLVRRGLAERRPAGASRRTHALYLTAAGKALLDHATALMNRHEQVFAAKLGSANLDRLRSMLAMLSDGLMPDVRPVSEPVVQRSPRRSRRSRLDGFV